MDDSMLSAVLQKAAAKYSTNNALNKMVAVNNEQGNKGMQKQQASTRTIYDSLSMVTAESTLRFFEGCASRKFPRTNLTQNRLEVNESTSFQFINFHIVTYSAAAALPVVSIEALGVTFAGMYRSDWSCEISTGQVVKPTPLDSQLPAFNRYAKHTGHEEGKMLTDLIIPPLTEFVIVLRTTNTTTSTTKEIMCTLEGAGVLNSPVTRY